VPLVYLDFEDLLVNVDLLDLWVTEGYRDLEAEPVHKEVLDLQARQVCYCTGFCSYTRWAASLSYTT